jgi:UDP-N-acetylglucosamine--N-acetylmuramyl-(pentapeptide) pyrophosphoryl-undecaprenol N-acetylglucosamine transferase
MSHKPVIVLTGGGSGGHITPILAVAAELKARKPDSEIIYIGQKGDGLGDIPAEHPAIDHAYTVRAGKLRRYHGEGFRQLLDIPTGFKNARDAVYVVIGIFQSRKLLKQIEPSIIFIKGGFVGVPVGLAAANLRIPYITHDSDAIPGLANRIISHWATLHAVALSKDIYNYPQDKTVTTGIPLQKEFRLVSEELKQKYRSDLGITNSEKLLFIIGGGLGAQRINNAVLQIMPHLLRQYRQLRVVHVVGRLNQVDMEKGYDEVLDAVERSRIKVCGYISDVYIYSGAADIIITRAGATNLAEFALQGKACIIIPSPFLTGGHQLKNAQYLMNRQAAIMIDESEVQDDPNRLAKKISILLKNENLQKELGDKLASFAKPKATEELADLLLQQLHEKHKKQNEVS